MMSFLFVCGVSRVIGNSRILSNVSLSVDKGEMVGVLGPNGAGKSTLFGLVAGVVRPTSGTIMFQGITLNGRSTSEICELGIVRTAQDTRPFMNMTVLENVMVGSYLRTDSRLMAQRRATEVLERLRLSDRSRALAKDLKLTDLKRLELARALATCPSLLLADEPLAGLQGDEVDALVTLLNQLRGEGLTVMVSEHRLDVIVSLCDRFIVLHDGQKVADGDPREILASQRVLSLLSPNFSNETFQSTTEVEGEVSA